MAPAREDCSHCHMSHGTVQPRLLKLWMPWLCQQCYLVVFHPSTVYSDMGVPPQGDADRLLVQGCLNCHLRYMGPIILQVLG
ncbi:cytochrome c3 family protein [Nitrosomonas cryotolerans]|uniref:cytochrome c3 family protein n=1 Tax=Nitrosomonas cryotolerans TaxID=44575 RepID=UPI0021090478|nr:cytochrome c3 family protein [Nitrosomonas cryotolerans]